MAEKAFAVKLRTEKTTTAAAVKEAVASVPGFFISGNGESVCDVMILEVGADLDEAFRQVEEIRGKNGAPEVFLTSSRKDPELLLRAMKAGVKEFFPQPINGEEMAASLVKYKTNRGGMEAAPEKNGTIIMIVGSKGGVGATTIAVNLAVAMQQAAGDRSVAVVDLSPLLGAVPLLLDIKTAFTWADAARDINRMDSTYLFHTLHKHSSGIYVLIAPSSPADIDAATPVIMERIAGRMRASFDSIIFDGSRFPDDLSRRILAISNTILIVCELNFVSIVNAKKLLDNLDGLGLSYGKDVKIVINRFQKRTMVTRAEAEKTLGKTIAAAIPNDYETIMAAINSGTTLSVLAGKSPLAGEIADLAALLLNREPVKKQSTALSFVKKNIAFARAIRNGAPNAKP